MRFITVILSLCFWGQSITGQTIEWVGDDAGDANNWHNAENWDLGRIPMEGDSVVIDGNNVMDSVYIREDVLVKNIYLVDGATLAIGEDIALQCEGSPRYGILIDDSQLYNHGFIVISDVGSGGFLDRGLEIRNFSSFLNNGVCTIMMTHAYGIRAESGSVVINNGGMEIDVTSSHGIRSGAGTFTNNGNITLGGAASSGITRADLSGAFINSGSIDITVAGMGKTGISVVNGGHFINSGSIDIDASSSARGSSMSGSVSKIDLDDGTFEVNLSDAQGFRILLASCPSVIRLK